MLENFFELNDKKNCKKLESREELIEQFSNSDDLRNAQFIPDHLDPVGTEHPTVLFENKKFTNISFSKTTMTRVAFRNCTFEDCLFLGTRFVDCRFNRCIFRGCNPHWVEFENTYIDPSVFERMLDSDGHSNIGMHLFQQLYDNSVRTNQREFANVAEFNRNIWKRHVLNYEFRERKDLTTFQYIREWLPNFLYHRLAGYGIRFRFLAVWICIVTVASVGINFFLWDSLDIVGRYGPTSEREFIHVLYYTATIPSGLGEFTPSSNLGRWIFLGESISGLVVVTLFATWVVKRALR